MLRVDWATHDAVKYACTHWHYSKSVPAGALVKIGVWESGKFVGVVLFSRGATPEIGSPYGLKQTEICELTRIALTTHVTPVSRIVRIAIGFLRKSNPNLRAVVSFADAGQGHHGGVYQAGNWMYLGGAETHAYKVNGKLIHPKTLHSRYGRGGQSIPWLQKNIDANAARVTVGFKHRYFMPLDAGLRAELEPKTQPYPKRAKEQDAGHPPALGGATPTCALHIETEHARR